MIICSDLSFLLSAVKNRGIVSIQCKNKRGDTSGSPPFFLRPLGHTYHLKVTIVSKQHQNKPLFVYRVATGGVGGCHHSCLNLACCLEVRMVWIPAPERRRPRRRFSGAVGMRVGRRSHVFHKLVASSRQVKITHQCIFVLCFSSLRFVTAAGTFVRLASPPAICSCHTTALPSLPVCF